MDSYNTNVFLSAFQWQQILKLISPRPIMLIAGENAHSRYYYEDAYKMASEPKELVIIPNADHVDLYDKLEIIPFDKLKAFFNQHLKENNGNKTAKVNETGSAKIMY